MTDYAKGTGSGSTGSGEGRTNIVRLRRNGLDSEDRQALCGVICRCNSMPSVGVSGQQLKQQCVSGRLKAADAISDHRSSYKAEVNYDMSRDPPAPIMDSGVVTKTHDYLPGWIQKYWPGGLGGYTPSVGNIRRPDIVIVNDPSLPPTQDNLKSVVEIKFPGDTLTRTQRDAYAQIAGDSSKVSVIGPDECDCDRGKTEQPSGRSAVSTSGESSFGAGLDAYLHSPPPPPAPPPVFVP